MRVEEDEDDQNLPLQLKDLKMLRQPHHVRTQQTSQLRYPCYSHEEVEIVVVVQTLKR